MKNYYFAFYTIVILALLNCSQHVSAFEGSTLATGSKYYLYNLYQSKFLQSDGITLSRTATEMFTATETGITINGTVFSASPVSGKAYKLTRANGALMFGTGTTCSIDDYSSGYNTSKAAWLLVDEEEYQAYTAKNRFTVASLNVDGMPKEIDLSVTTITLNADAKEADGATAIGKKILELGYDIIGVSEDFNFDEYIMEQISSSYNEGTHQESITVGNANLTNYLSSKPLFDTDGLNLFYRNALTVSNETMTAWNQHYGYTSDGADGLIKKGFRYYTVRLTDDTEFDLYILHGDAETSAEDNAARETQIVQLATTIKNSSNKRPVIVMGDTNCRYTRDKLKALFINALEEDPRFTVKDPWIEYGRDGVYPAWDGTNDHSIMVGTEGYLSGEVVDKVFYINNKESDTRINALSYAQDLSFINDSGEPLADHWPAVVEFEYHKYNPATDDTEQKIERYTWKGVDPVTGGTEGSTQGGTYYIYHPNTGKFLTNNGKSLELDYTTTTTWTITYNSVSKGIYTVNMRSSNGGYYFNLAKSGTWGTSATPTLSTGIQTTQISASDNTTYSTMSPFKIHRTTSPARYLNFDGSSFTGAQNLGDQNDWVFIPVDQYNEQHPQDYTENGVHYYKGIYASGNVPTITAPAPSSSKDDNVYAIDMTYATGAAITSLKVDVSNNPNILIHAKEGDVKNTINVITAGTGRCADFVLTDGYPFHSPDAIYATKASYTRTTDNEWGTVCLPFPYSSNDDTQFYTIQTYRSKKLFLTPVSTVLAGQPVIYHALKKNEAGQYVLNISDNNVIVKSSDYIRTDTQCEGWTVNGTYCDTSIKSEGNPYRYLYNGDKLEAASDATTIPAYRAWIETSLSDGEGTIAVSVYGLGDANHDGKADATDVTVVVNKVLSLEKSATEGEQPSSEIDDEVSDMNDDGVVNILDAVLIIDKIQDR